MVVTLPSTVQYPNVLKGILAILQFPLGAAEHTDPFPVRAFNCEMPIPTTTSLRLLELVPIGILAREHNFQAFNVFRLYVVGLARDFDQLDGECRSWSQ